MVAVSAAVATRVSAARTAGTGLLRTPDRAQTLPGRVLAATKSPTAMTKNKHLAEDMQVLAVLAARTRCHATGGTNPPKPDTSAGVSPSLTVSGIRDRD